MRMMAGHTYRPKGLAACAYGQRRPAGRVGRRVKRRHARLGDGAAAGRRRVCLSASGSALRVSSVERRSSGCSGNWEQLHRLASTMRESEQQQWVDEHPK